jgi:hypothetical protein
MFEYLAYILFFSTLIVILIYIYIRLKFGFWALQPVFHIYDIHYIFSPPGIIIHYLPEKNKYTNFKNIETILYSELSDIKKTNFVNFIKLHYLQNKDNIFSPLSENVLPYFNSHSDKSFISFYNEDRLIFDLKKGTNIPDKKTIGIMSSRPIHIFINNGNKDAKFDAYYVDYLCVDKTFRKKGIAPQIIQTHHYNQRHINKNIAVSLFKREDELTGIVPLCVYSTYGFSVDKWTKPNELHSQYRLIEINQQNFHFLNDYIKSNYSNFDIIINTEFTNIIELIKTKNIFIYAIMFNNKFISCYFYRKSCIFIEKNREVLSCFASINNCDDNVTFVQGFKLSFWKIANENYFGFAAIENLSHNNIIINDIVLKTTPLVVSPTAYFFYNFAYPTFKSEKTLIIT